MAFEWVRDFIAPGFGVLLGVVAGACIQFALQWFHAKLSYKRHLRGMEYELKYAKVKILEMIEALRKLSSAAATGTLENYFYFFKFSDFLSASTRILFENASIYKILTQEEISKLLKVFHDFSSDAEMVTNNKIRQIKANDDKKEAALFATYSENKFDDNLKIIESILAKIK